MDIWTTPPTFAAGQAISANGHLQALTDNVNVILGKYTAPQTLWSARRVDDYYSGDTLPEGNHWRRMWSGYIRNKTNVLEYGVKVGKDSALKCKIRITYGSATHEQTVSNGSGSQTITASLDVSAYSGFYFVAIDYQMLNGTTPTASRGSCTIAPLYLHETDAQTYATLARFYTGDTPTAAQWQALSDRASTLYAQTGGVGIPFVGNGGVRTWGNSTTPLSVNVWNGTLVHANRYLYFDLRVKMPQLWTGGNDPNHGTLVAVVYYNGTMLGGRGYGALDTGTSLPGTVVLKDATYFYQNQVIRLQSGHMIRLGTKSTNTFTGCTQLAGGWRAAAVGDSIWHLAETQPESDAEEGFRRWVGTFDLNALGMTDGTRYEVQVVAYDNIHTYGTNTTGWVNVVQLAEQPASQPTLSGWSSMPTWEHADIVTGTGSARTIRDNLVWLSSRIVYGNQATPARRWDQPDAWLIREYDWLHYYCAYTEGGEQPEPQPSIGFMYGNEWQESSLPFEPNKWMAYDLRGMAHLWPGTKYRVRDITYALEDNDS